MFFNRNFEFLANECTIFSMANMLSKFRLDYSSLTMLQSITDKPQPETVRLFENIIEKFRESEQSGSGIKLNYNNSYIVKCMC
jgi:hypothetical protein